MRTAPLASASASAPASPPTAAAFDDASLLYMEEVLGDKAIAFARAHNAVSEGELKADPRFASLEKRLDEIYSSKAKIPTPEFAPPSSIRNFWTDADHPRGLFRITTFDSYKKADPQWTTLIDVDALNKDEKESFVFHGASCLYPLERRCLVRLSRGGTDAEIVREYDIDKKAFVSEKDKAFVLPEAKLTVAWKDENTIYVGTSFGPGSATRSGLPRVIKEWKRGQPLSEAQLLFEVKETDLAARCWRSFDHDIKRDFCSRDIDFEHNELSMRGADGKLVHVDKPQDSDAGVWEDDLLLKLRSDFTHGGVTFKKGALLITKLKGSLAGKDGVTAADPKREIQVLFEPTKQSSLADWSGTKTHIITNVLSDVKNQLTVFTRDAKGKWTGASVKEERASVEVWAVDPNRSDDAWMWVEDFTQPSALELLHTNGLKREPLKKKPSFFEASGLEVTQHFATSKDGTKIPYFEIAKKGRAGAGPTLLEAYGGFEISLTAYYNAGVGAAWLERGGTYVQANLRGGGEYGPAWHEAAMKHHRQNAYDDLAAVAEDLVRRGVTTSKQLGVMGGSNGGLLTSVMLTQRPDLFGAIVSKVPLTDMKRFHKLLTGAAWIGEYGDPDDAEDWAALAKFSPLHNVKAGAPYPPILYTTSTKDDRVHPAHARKMVAKLEALGYKPLYYENIEGGHGGAADIKQRAYLDALTFTFLLTRLGLK